MTDPKIKLPEVNVDADAEKFTPVVTGKSGSSETMQNQSNMGTKGKETSFRTDLPSVDQMFDENNHLKPDIEAEANKASDLTNEPAQIRSDAYKGVLQSDWASMNKDHVIEAHDVGSSPYFPHNAFGVGSSATPFQNISGEFDKEGNYK